MLERLFDNSTYGTTPRRWKVPPRDAQNDKPTVVALLVELMRLRYQQRTNGDLLPRELAPQWRDVASFPISRSLDMCGECCTEYMGSGETPPPRVLPCAMRRKPSVLCADHTRARWDFVGASTALPAVCRPGGRGIDTFFAAG